MKDDRSSVQGPTRLLDQPDGGTGLNELLAAGRSELPGDARGDRMLAGILASAAAAGAISTAAGASTAATGAAAAKAIGTVKSGIFTKLVVIGVVSTLAVGGSVGAMRVVRSRGEASITTASAPVTTVVAPPVATPSAPVVADPPVVAAPPAEPAPSESAHPTTVKPAARASSSATAESEAQLLLRAREALGDRPGEALSLASQHARKYPTGALAQEREVIAIEALVRLDRRAEARERADRFLKRAPSSAYRQRIENLVR